VAVTEQATEVGAGDSGVAAVVRVVQTAWVAYLEVMGVAVGVRAGQNHGRCSCSETCTIDGRGRSASSCMY
jgi:hypothetical protein